MAGYVECQTSGRLACVAKGTSARSLLDDRIVALALTRQQKKRIYRICDNRLINFDMLPLRLSWDDVAADLLSTISNVSVCGSSDVRFRASYKAAVGFVGNTSCAAT